MENASKALIIAGAILLSILIIAIGIFIFNGANSTITDSMTSMSTQEIEAFNNQFLSYDGKQSGSNIKALIGKLVANGNTYKEEPDKVPTLDSPDKKFNSSGTTIENATYAPNGGWNLQDYVTQLSLIRNAIENKHTYTVNFKFGTKGLIEKISITY